MNEDMIRAMIRGMSEDESNELGNILTGMGAKIIKGVESELHTPREQEVFELGKQIGVIEFLVNEYESL